MHHEKPISSIENLRRAVAGKALWTPSWSEIQNFAPRIIPDTVARGFVIDAHPIDNDTQAGGPDMFGVKWEWVPEVGGSMVRPGVDPYLKDISRWEEVVTFPDPASYDWEGSVRENAGFFERDRISLVWFFTGLFERLISFMDFENAAVALVYEDQKPYVHALFDRLCTLYEDFFARFKKYYDIDVLYFHDDWGGQYAPFFSLKTVREMLLPYLKRLAGSAHREGLLFDFHSCGKIENFVPVMIEADVDIWSGQMLNDMRAVLEKHAGEILVEINPGFDFGVEYPVEEAKEKTQRFFDEYGAYLGSVIFQDFSAGVAPSEMVFERTLNTL